MAGPGKVWLLLAISLSYLAPDLAAAQNDARNDAVPLIADWGSIAVTGDETGDESSMICAEATGYLSHAREEIETDFRRLYTCVDRRVRAPDGGSCEEPVLTLQSALAVLGDANDQFATVCP